MKNDFSGGKLRVFDRISQGAVHKLRHPRQGRRFLTKFDVIYERSPNFKPNILFNGGNDSSSRIGLLMTLCSMVLNLNDMTYLCYFFICLQSIWAMRLLFQSLQMPFCGFEILQKYSFLFLNFLKNRSQQMKMQSKF